MAAARVWVAVQATDYGQTNNVMFRSAELCGADYLERFRGVLVEMRGVRGQALVANYRRDLEVELGTTDRALFISIIRSFIYETNDVNDNVTSLRVARFAAYCTLHQSD